MVKYSIRPISLTAGAPPLTMKLYQSQAGVAVCSAINVFFIEGARKKILVDTGATAEGLAKRGFSIYRHVQTIEQGLAKLGLKCEDIELVILTQLHYDHINIDGAPKFKKAKFLIQKAELDWNSNPPAYDPRRCDQKLLDMLDIQVVDGDHQVEPGIKLLFTPGHTAGGQSVAVDTAKGLAIIDGMCSVDENYNPPESMKWSGPVVVPGIHTEVAVAYNSLMRIKKMADIIIPLHESRMIWTDRIP